MDRSKKLDKQTLYEIYRACRLCGAGAGYKMPIIQNLVKVDGEQIELKQKIRECLQLEVNSNDKMPPLICESCVDKIDDFYEFLISCRQTNANTRKQLGLPLQETPPAKVIPAPVKVYPAPAKITPVAKKVVSKDIGTETCMLGLIEASAVKQDIYIIGKQSDSKRSKKNNIKKEDVKLESPVKPDNSPALKNPTLKDLKLGKDKDIKQAKEIDNKRKSEPSPKRVKRRKNSIDDLLMDRGQETPKNLPINKPGPKSRKIETKDDPWPSKPTRAKEKEDPPPRPTRKEDELSKSKVKKERDDEPLTKWKRVRERDGKRDLTPPPAKRTKTSEPQKPSQPTRPQKTSKPSPKSVQTATTSSKNVQPDGLPCPACDAVLKNLTGFKSHMHYVHPVTWTPDNLACNACRAWFPTIDESVAHHKRHQHYKCLRCKKRYKNGVLYHQHIENKRCLPDQETPDVKCDSCLRLFPTNNLLKEHRCQGYDGRQGGKCSKCNRRFTLLKNLTKHESTCMFRKKEIEPVIDPEVKKMLLPMEVRITKCDDLLQYGPVVSACTVPHRFGLDRKMAYPYMPKLRVIKKPTYNPMVSIMQDDIKDEFNTDDLDWGDFEDIELKTVKKLSTLSLKVIFSSQMFGELEVLDEIEIARRSALRKRINSIIFKFDDSSSNNSDSILDKNSLAKTFDVVNDEFGTEDKNYHSDSTVFNETTVAEEEEKYSDAKMDDFDRDIVENYDNYVNLGADIGRIDNHRLNSSILSNTDVDMDKICDTSIVNMKEPSNKYLELSKTLRDQVTDNSSSILSTVNEDKLENSEFEVDKLKMVNNPTDTVNEKDTPLDESMRFDNIRSSNDSPSVVSTENSTNDKDSTIVTENHDILLKNDVDPNSSEEAGIKLTENAIITKNAVINDETFQNNENNVDSESTINENKALNSKIEHSITFNDTSNSSNTCEAEKGDAVNNDDSLNDCDVASEEPRDSVIESNDSLTNDDKLSIIDSDLTGNTSNTEIMEIDTETNNLDSKSVSSEDITKNPQHDNSNDNNLKLHEDGQKTEVQNMDIDETCGKNCLNLEITTKVSENDDTESKETVSYTKIDKDNDQSEDSYTKNSEFIKNTNPNTENNPNHDTVQNINVIETKSPQKANKSLDFSVTGILNHVTSKTIETDTKNTVINTEKDNSAIRNTESIENDTVVNTEQEHIAENDTKNDKINDDNQFPDNTSLNEGNDENSSVKNDSDIKNNKQEDTISLNSVSTTFTDKNDDTLSLNSIKYNIDNSNVHNSDKFNVNDLSEDERKLMAELDEQIGETNEKIDKLNDGRDLNLESFSETYNFD